MTNRKPGSRKGVLGQELKYPEVREELVLLELLVIQRDLKMKYENNN